MPQTCSQKFFNASQRSLAGVATQYSSLTVSMHHRGMLQWLGQKQFPLGTAARPRGAACPSVEELVHRQLGYRRAPPRIDGVRCPRRAGLNAFVAERDDPLGKRVRDPLASLGAFLDRDDPLEPLEQRGDLGGVEHHVAIDVDRAPVRLQVDAPPGFCARLVDALVRPIPRRAAFDREGGRRRGERVGAQRAVGESVDHHAGGGPVELAAAVAPVPHAYSSPAASPSSFHSSRQSWKSVVDVAGAAFRFDKLAASSIFKRARPPGRSSPRRSSTAAPRSPPMRAARRRCRKARSRSSRRLRPCRGPRPRRRG